MPPHRRRPPVGSRWRRWGSARSQRPTRLTAASGSGPGGSTIRNARLRSAYRRAASSTEGADEPGRFSRARAGPSPARDAGRRRFLLGHSNHHASTPPLAKNDRTANPRSHRPRRAQRPLELGHARDVDRTPGDRMDLIPRTRRSRSNPFDGPRPERDLLHVQARREVLRHLYTVVEMGRAWNRSTGSQLERLRTGLHDPGLEPFDVQEHVEDADRPLRAPTRHQRQPQATDAASPSGEVQGRVATQRHCTTVFLRPSRNVRRVQTRRVGRIASDPRRRGVRTEFRSVFATVYLLTGRASVAEAAAQEAFVRALERWSRLADKEWVAGWIITTAINVVAGSSAGERRSNRSPRRIGGGGTAEPVARSAFAPDPAAAGGGPPLPARFVHQGRRCRDGMQRARVPNVAQPGVAALRVVTGGEHDAGRTEAPLAP